MNPTKSPSRLLCWAASHVALLTLALITLIPMIWMVCAALKTREDYFTFLFLPGGDGFLGVAWNRLTLANIVKVFSEANLARSVLNSFFYASVTSVVGTLCCAMGGFALSKYAFRGQGILLGIVLAALIIPGPLLLAPGYQWIFQLGLLNTFSGLILPGLASAFGVFLFRQSMIHTVPGELLEAARIDGCGEFRLFFTIVLPIIKPTVGAFLIITFLGAWNNFLSPQIILQSPERQPLAVAVAQMKGLYSQDYGMLMAGTLVAVVPVLILFLLLQREFLSGLTAGAVKQ